MSVGGFFYSCNAKGIKRNRQQRSLKMPETNLKSQKCFAEGGNCIAGG